LAAEEQTQLIGAGGVVQTHVAIFILLPPSSEATVPLFDVVHGVVAGFISIGPGAPKTGSYCHTHELAGTTGAATTLA
jgi:hypothetical protein